MAGQPVNERMLSGSERAAAFPDALAVLRRLAGTGATLVIEAPGPMFRTPPFRCTDWFNRRNPVCADGFTVPRAELIALRRPALDAMNRLAASVPTLHVWDPFPILCPADPCTPWRAGRLLYEDTDHLSQVGNRLLYSHLRRAVAPGKRPP